MSKKIYISPIVEIEDYQLNVEICAGSPNDDEWGDIEDGNGDNEARLRGGYYDVSVHQAEFGNLW